MSFEFQSTLINLTPEFRVSGEQIGGVRLYTNSRNQKVARVIITGDKDLQFAASGAPYEVGDPGGIYATLSANLAEILEDELLINPSAISSVKYTAEEIIIQVEGDNRAWRFRPSSDPDLLGSKEIADHTYELTAAAFAALTTAAGTFRESVDGTLEGLNTAITTEVADRIAAIDAEAGRVDALIASGMWLFDDQASFPDAATNHGRVVHSHADGAIFYAHGGMWHQVAKEVDLQSGNAATLASANAYTDTSISNIIGSAPGVLDTLGEISNAINDDSNVYTTLVSQINAVQSDVDQNEVDSDAADSALSGRLDVLEADPTTATAVAAVQADVDQNESDSDAADAALSGRLDVLEADPTTATAVAAVQADVDQNESDADAADAALSGRLDVLEADPTTATAVAAVQADVDQNETDSDAADAALSARIDVLEADPATATAVTANTSDIADIRSVTGTLDGSTHLGNFSGAIITDGIAIKTALQELSNAIEATQTDVDGNEADADTADALRVLLDGTNIPGPYANDAAAASGGVPVGAIYKHDNGQIHYRVS